MKQKVKSIYIEHGELVMVYVGNIFFFIIVLRLTFILRKLKVKIIRSFGVLE